MITTVIDIGHGADDPGAVGKTLNRSITESEIVLSIGKILDSMIDYEDNMEGILTRTKIDEKPSFQKRANIAELANQDNPGKTFMLSLHADGFFDEDAEGSTLFHWPGSTKGKNLSLYLQDQLKFRPIGCRGIKENDKFLIIKGPKNVPVVLVETGFITNPGDARYLHSVRGRIETAECIFRGLKNFQEVIE